MDPGEARFVSPRSCLRHANRALAAAAIATSRARKRALMKEYRAWIARHRLTVTLLEGPAELVIPAGTLDVDADLHRSD
jgi:hypothetical protein